MAGIELSNLRQIVALQTIADAYLYNELDIDRATRLAGRRGSIGLLYAGELALQHAVDNSEASYIERAKSFFNSSMDIGRATMESSAVRSEYRLTQMNMYSEIVNSDKLPKISTLKKSYKKVLDFAHKTVSRQNRPFQESNDNDIELVGTNTEIAVGILAMREAIKIHDGESSEIYTTWLPIQSTFCDDQGGQCFVSSDNSWDLTVYTQLDKVPEISYRVNIKTTEKEPRPTAYVDLTHLRVSPDLELYADEKSIARSIIIGAYHEQAEPNKYERLVTELDERGQKLIDVLG